MQDLKNGEKWQVWIVKHLLQCIIGHTKEVVQFKQIVKYTIDGNVEFVHSQYTVFLRHKCQQLYVSDKIINNSDISAILCSLFSVFTLFYLIMEIMSTNGRKCCLPCYLTLVSSCIIGPFLCCHILNLIIFLVHLFVN